jgi:hypothetical protein
VALLRGESTMKEVAPPTLTRTKDRNMTLGRIAVFAAVATIAAATVSAQSVLFDFNNAPVHTSLPITQTVSGITAHFSATGQGFSIQDTSSPVVPIGFTGRFIYPNSINAADLLITFDQTINDFSILYSPQELGCDDSATMLVTATLNGNLVGTNTKTASNPGTWPVDTLRCTFASGFNKVVVHYNSHPPTCQDYGVIFLADDMRVTPMTMVATPFCFGDGSGTACPCGNAGAAGNGCAHSLNALGATLSGSGTPSIANDSFVLWGIGMPTSSALFFQGTAQTNGGLGTVFGDGLRCAGGAVIRLGTKSNVAGASRYPSFGDPNASVTGLVGTPGLRTYQVWYRNSATFCSPDTFNLTNAVQVNWTL